MRSAVAMIALLAACGGDDAPAQPDAANGVDAADIFDGPSPDGDEPVEYGEQCGNAVDDDGDGLVDEDCAPNLFSGIYAPGVATDPALTAIASAGGRVDVLQTYHSMSATGVSRIGPDLAAIFAAGKVAHLNVEPADYTPAQLAAPTADPVAHDVAAMADALVAALAGNHGRVLLTFGAEMNGTWTSWGCLPAAQFIALYRSAHDAVTTRLAGAGIDARRVRWAFGPDARGTASCARGWDYYPGHAYVDLLGLSAYRAATEDVATTITTPMTALLDGAAIDHDWRTNRFVVLQTGSRATDRSAFVSAMYTAATTDPRIAGIIYFDASADWSIPTADPAFPAWTAATGALPPADHQLDAVFAPHFWDVPYGAAAFAEVQALRDHAITTGCGTAPPRFCPAAPLTRRAAAVWLAAAFALPAGPTTPTFSDVPASDPAFAAIQALAGSAATPGCAAGMFCPDATISEVDLAAIASALGDDVFAPDQPATRASGAALVAHAAHLGVTPF